MRWSRARRSPHDDANRFTLYVCSQGVTGMRANIAEALGVDAKAVRILTGQVGGSFGMKGGVFPEYICILHGTRTLGRPVKWTDERSGSFFSDSHGRDHVVTAELALAEDGTFLAIRFNGFAGMGAFLSPMGPFLRHRQHRKKRAEHVPHAADRTIGKVRFHQHLADRPLSRRRPARGQLFHGANDRYGRNGDGHRSYDAAAAQSDPAARAPLQDRIRRDL